MKIAQVITRMVPGGASKVVRSIVQGLDERFEQDLITGPEDKPADLEGSLNEVVRVKIVDSLVRDIHPLSDIRALLKLRRIFREEDYDLVHTHTSKAGVVGRIAAGWADVDRIVHSPHGLIYHPDGDIPGVPGNQRLQDLLLSLDRWAGGYQDILVTLSNEEKRFCDELDLSPPQSTRVIPNGIELERFQFTREDVQSARGTFEIDPDAIVLLTVGRLAEEKGIDRLIEAFSELRHDFPNLRLLVAGKGPERNTLEELANKKNVSAYVQFTGYVDAIELAYAAADVYVHPARYEGFGLSVLEAMAAGLPVVATRVGGIPELLEDGSEGVLVKSEGSEPIATGLRTILRDQNFMRRLGTNAKDRAKRFNRAKMVGEYRDLYLSLFSDGR